MIKNLFESKFVRNVIIVASGTAGAQAIAMVSSPVLTRMYGPEAFGVMGTFSSMINILAPLAALAYPIAIVLPKEDNDAKAIIKLSFNIALSISLLSLLILVVFNDHLVSLLNISEVKTYMYFIPLILLSSALMQIMEQWMIRTKQFKVSSKVTFTQSLIVNSSKIGIGIFYPVTKVLIFFTSIAFGLKAILMYMYAKHRPKAIKDHTITLKKQYEIAKEYKDFPYFRAPEIFLNSVSTGLPIILLTAFFNPIIAGYYSVVRLVLSLPTQLIGKAVGDVFYPRITEAKNNGENITYLIKKATFYLGMIGIFPFGLIIAFGPQLFSIVFGDEWATSGEYARWIALWSFVAFMNRPSVMALPVLKAQRFHLVYTIFMLVTRLGVLSLGFFLYNDDLRAIAFYGVSGAILNVGLILITMKLSKKLDRQVMISEKIS